MCIQPVDLLQRPRSLAISAVAWILAVLHVGSTSQEDDTVSPEAAARDLQLGADVLRQGLADGTVPPTADRLAERLEQLGSRIRSLPTPPSDADPGSDRAE